MVVSRPCRRDTRGIVPRSYGRQQVLGSIVVNASEGLPSTSSVLRKARFMPRMRLWLSALVLAGCVVRTSNPQPYYQQPPPQYAQDPQPPPQDPQQPPQVAQQDPPPSYDPPPDYQPPPPTEPAEPPPPTYSDPIYTDLNVEAAGNDVPSVDVFYDQLSPHGTWYEDPTYGWVFAPMDPSYLPYTNGRWINSDYGFTWVSNDPFGWATDHYGRWLWANR